MRAISKSMSWCLIAVVSTQQILGPAAQAENWFRQPTTSVEQLARKIDKVQKHLDVYGTIATKTPDVWGESRLLRHREEFEQELYAERGNFEFRLSAAESTRDTAFLASALALQNALGSGGNLGGLTPLTVVDSSKKESTVPDNTVISVTSQLMTPSSELDSKDSDIIPRTADFGPTFTSNIESVEPKKEGERGRAQISIEPEIYLDQKARYLNHLHEIRRLNEGDDTADSPGYALNLVRIPVSVLPGKHTRIGYGAEVTISVEPFLSDELLPNAFRDFVVNGVVDRLAPKVCRVINLGDTKIDTLEKQWLKHITDVSSAKESPQEGEISVNYDAYSSLLGKAEYRMMQSIMGEDGGSQSSDVADAPLSTSTSSDQNLSKESHRSDNLGDTRRTKVALADTHELMIDGFTSVIVMIEAHSLLEPSPKHQAHLEDVRRHLQKEVSATYENVVAA